MTLYDAYCIFINDKKCSCSDDTIIYYSYNLDRFINYAETALKCPVKDIPCNSIDRSVLTGFIQNLRSADRRIKNTSINTYMRAVKIFLHWCYNENFMENDIFRNMKLPRQDSESIIPLCQYEIDRIDAQCNLKTESGLRNACIIHLMVDSGLRRNEVINLHIRDIMFDKNIINVYGKGGKYRVVPMCSKLKNILYRYCVMYRSFTAGEVMEQFLFLKVSSQEHITKSSINQLFRRLKVKTSIERLHPHLLRHTFATSYIMGGGNLEFLRLIMGHSDYNITRRYLHLANQYTMMQTDIYKLDAVYFKSAY